MRGWWISMLVWGFVTLLATLTSGCLIAGYAASIAQGPPKVEAKYKPTSRPMAVVVESSRQKGNAGQIREQLSGLLAVELRRNNVAEVVESYKVHDLRQSDPKAFRAMTVDEIGKKVGAEQVLYVDLLQADVSENTGGVMMKGIVTAEVRLVDVPTGKVLWPQGLGDGYLVSVETPYKATKDSSARDAMREGLARGAADTIAKLFYTWVIPEKEN